jgi:hypothetical protein
MIKDEDEDEIFEAAHNVVAKSTRKECSEI